MKNINDLRKYVKVGLLVVSLIMVSSCSFFIKPITLVEAPPGTLNVRIAEESSARTILPSLSASAESYVITCTQDGATVATETLTSQSYTFSDLPVATTIVTVNAYNNATTQDSTTLIATGSTEVTITSGTVATASITLVYEQSTDSGSGSISYTIEWPETSADRFTWSLYGENDETITSETTVTPGSATDGNFTATITKSSVPVGSYFIIIKFYKDDEIAGYAYESVNVYDNLVSDNVVGSDGSLSTTRVFTADEIASTDTDLSLLIVAGGESETISLDSDTLSGSYNSSTVSTITVFPMVGESGQTITYTWQSGSADTTDSVLITSGSPISLTLATSTDTESATNTLSLTVTAANTDATTTYTITMLSPIYVDTEGELTNAFSDMANNVVLTADIDLSTTWTPIGSNDNRFTGTFDGGGYSITGLTVATTSDGDTGLFAAADSTAHISNVRLVNVSISSTAGDGVGALVGENFGIITNCSVSGTVSGYEKVGGLVGCNRDTGIISECYSTASVSASNRYAGGLVGSNWSVIENCYARSAVSLSSSGTETIGGLVGKSYSGTIANCCSSGTLFNSTVPGGLIGVNDGTCTSSYYNSELCGLSDTGKGDPLTTDEMKNQDNFTDWDFTDIWAIDSDVNTAYPYLKAIPPEIIEISSSDISTGSALYDLISGDLSADYLLTTDITLTGNLTPIGSSDAPFTGTINGDCYTISGLTISTDTADSGMFVSVGVGATVENLYLTNVSISGDTTFYKGGLAAYNYGTIYRCTSSGSVEGDEYVGGLIGENCGTISECWSNATIDGNYYTGGLVGANGSDTTAGIIENCYARGTVTTTSGGGLVGSNVSGTISNSYAAGQVLTSGGDLQAFVGKNEAAASIINCYYDESKIVNSYADDAIMATGFNGTPKTGIEMRIQTTFDSWDFTESTGMWVIERGKNGGYPYLQNVEPTSDTEISSAADFASITDLNGDYILTASVDSLGVCTIGDTTTPFTGSFDGNDKIITGLEMDSSVQYLGLFGYVEKAGFLRNVILKDVSIQEGYFAGALIGKNYGTIYRCASSGSVSGSSTLGGLICRNFGLISECYSVVSVSGTSHLGGLVADNYTSGRVINSYARGAVTGTDYLGGLLGSTYDNADNSISNSYSTGTVSSTSGGTRIGGLIGEPATFSDALVTNCYFDQEISGQTTEIEGKINATSTSDMKSSTTFSEWDITTSSSDTIWGIDTTKAINDGYPYLQWAGENTMSLVQISSESMTVSELNTIITADLSANYALTGDITLSDADTTDWTPIGSSDEPFTGTFDGGGHTISGITVSGSRYSGMFHTVGTGGIVENLNVYVSITGLSGGTGDDNKYKGGITAYNYGTIYRCSASGQAEGYTGIGGLVGINVGTIRECWSDVEVNAGYLSGGLVGYNGEPDYADYPNLIVDCYVLGAVTVDNGAGLVGETRSVGTIRTSYVACSVTNSSEALDGGTPGTVENCFYDSDLCASSTYGTGKSTSEMKTLSTFSGTWDIASSLDSSSVWGIGSIDGTLINNGYPYLQWTQ